MIIHGTGCCLIDYLYAHENFFGPRFKAALSRSSGDGGLSPGKLVFAENFQRYMNMPYEEALKIISYGKEPDSFNLGGPSVVALAHAAQIGAGGSHRVSFFGVRGNDKTGDLIEQALSRIPFDQCHITVLEGPSPRTDVLSDPSYDRGHGERSFINLLGTAALFRAEDLDPSFFDADIIAFGASALLPLIHEKLSALLKSAREKGAATVVNLVYDYLSEQKRPGEKWKLGANDDAYPYIDILIADREEALKTSGRENPAEAAAWFIAQGAGAVVISDGSRPVFLEAGKGLFKTLEAQTMEVSQAINRDLALHPERRGDTTGCGDNFAGGIIAGMAEQLSLVERGNLDLRECVIPGIVAGGFACFTLGGTFNERYIGEKQELIEPYIREYREGNEFERERVKFK
jgi:sugar/nucleoside kinase (ribokinase family)